MMERNWPKHVEFYSKNKFENSVLILLASCMTYTISACTVKKNPDDGQGNCPKHVEFYSKNKFENSVLILLASCQQICMTYTIAACTVKKS